jgi:hypothetical protein
MAIPTQATSGTEVLRRGSINAQSSTDTYLKFDNTAITAAGNQSNTVPANHIVTVLNVIFCEQGNASELFTMWAEGPHASGIHFLYHQSIGAYQTFVWKEKIVLIGGDALRINTGSAANIDIYYSYIDQSWV